MTYMCSNVGCGRIGPADKCEACGWPMTPIKEPQAPPPAREDWSESSDPNFDSDPDDGGD